MNLQEKSQKYLLQTYAKYPIEITKGKGSYVWDSNGKKYLDFYGGHAVCLLGHCPDPVLRAVQKQSETLLFYSNIFDMAPAADLAEKLAESFLPEVFQVYFSNSGSEANETALKIARKYTGKKHVISFRNAFHGRGMYPLAVTGIDSYHQFEPSFDDHTSFAELGDMESVRNAYQDDTAGVICEPIQSIGGVNMADSEFYRELRAFCDEKNILLLFDEIQTGLGRTGTFWFSETIGITPDITTTAKGIASGLPLSAVLIHERISKTIGIGEHATTFGGGPVVCAAANATLDILLQKGFLEEVQRKSKRIVSALKKDFEVLGKGLLLGIKTKKPGKELVRECLEKGLIIGTSMHPNTVRIMPPLTITDDEISLFLEVFSKGI